MPLARFGPTTTAKEVVQNVDLRGKLAVLTGASIGIGAETARVLAMSGADIMIGARQTSKLTALSQELDRSYGVKAYVYPLDLSDQTSINSFADAVLMLSRPLDILCVNVGLVTHERAVNGCDNELQFSVNSLGHALLVSRLAAVLAKGTKSGLVCLSSCGHQQGPIDFEDPNFEVRPYSWLLAYRQSKSAMALLALKAQSVFGPKGVTCFSVHPGVIRTELQQLTLLDIQRHAGKIPVADPARYKSVAQSAATSVWAVAYPGIEAFGGAYLEDCSVAPPVDEVNPTYGGMQHARDPVLADKTWRLAERLLGRELAL